MVTCRTDRGRAGRVPITEQVTHRQMATGESLSGSDPENGRVRLLNSLSLDHRPEVGRAELCSSDDRPFAVGAGGADGDIDGTVERQGPAGRALAAAGRAVRVARVRRLAAALLVSLLVLIGCSVGDALRAPGNDSVAAKLAEWGRDHGFDGVITWLEQKTYRPPPTGGEPVGGIAEPGGEINVTQQPRRDSHPEGLPGPTTMTPLTHSPALPGEGVWHPVSTVRGRPAVQVATLRPDPAHTSFLAGLMWIDPTLVRGQLQPGTMDPGGHWQAADHITPQLAPSLVAVFNAGFRLNGASGGGYYSEHRTVVPLRNGAASLVLNNDGTAQVGAWNRDVRMGPAVASVRQNLVLLVDGGKVNPTCASGGTAQWGSTIGQAAFIHRSGFGVTANGAEVYVGGPALSVCSLGNLLAAAGVVRGMELDINPNWVSGTYFHRNPHGNPKGFRLFPGEQVSPAHYFTTSSRDWYGWYARH
ncbi:MAG TPA: hypothetical protein VGM60_10710 [Pseudonocardia sp.]|uniref:hypothetical protein n=1 Tax=Pseudonocardia sp. TaxID=60912 RepID=UPI002F415C0D